MQWTKYILNFYFSSFLTICFCSLLFKQQTSEGAVQQSELLQAKQGSQNTIASCNQQCELTLLGKKKEVG